MKKVSDLQQTCKKFLDADVKNVDYIDVYKSTLFIYIYNVSLILPPYLHTQIYHSIKKNEG